MNISYIDKGIIAAEYLDSGIIAVDGKVVHFGKQGTKVAFYFSIIVGLLVLSFMMFFINQVIKDDLLVFLVIFVTLYLLPSLLLPMKDMLFSNQIDVDFAIGEISTTNVFGKKKKYPIKEMGDINFCHGVYWGNRRHFYKIVLNDQKNKFIVIRGIPFKKEAKKLCLLLNDFKRFSVDGSEGKNMQALKDLSLISDTLKTGDFIEVKP